jgi:hypothetical protein
MNEKPPPEREKEISVAKIVQTFNNSESIHAETPAAYNPPVNKSLAVALPHVESPAGERQLITQSALNEQIQDNRRENKGQPRLATTTHLVFLNIRPVQLYVVAKNACVVASTNNFYPGTNADMKRHETPTVNDHVSSTSSSSAGGSMTSKLFDAGAGVNPNSNSSTELSCIARRTEPD